MGSNRFQLASIPIAAAIVAAVLTPTTAAAELGGPMASVFSDGGQMGAKMASVAMGAYTRHDLTRVNGGAVTEYTNAAGMVFAVAWSGAGKPDLRTLLGPYFATFQASNSPNSGAAGRAMHSLRRPPQVADTDLQIQTGGYMGWFHGVAFVPSLAPANFAVADLSRAP